MAWTVELKESVIDDLRWFGRKEGRLVLVGEKRGDALFVRGEEFRGHHENHPAD